VPSPINKKPVQKKKLGPPVADEKVVLSRFKGALLGLCVGDALGLPMDLRQTVTEPFPKLNDGPYTEMRAPNTGRVGQVGWVSEIAESLASSLRNEQAYDILAVAKSYRKYQNLTWPTGAESEDSNESFKPPQAFADAMLQLEDGRHPDFTGFKVWLEGQQRIRDAGALPRALVLGAFYSHPSMRVVRHEAIADDTAMTHFDPLCQLISTTLGALVAEAIHSPLECLDTPGILKLLETELSFAAATLGRKHSDWVMQFKDCADWLREDIAASKEDDPFLYGPELYLFRPVPPSARVVFRLALWELFHAQTLEAALVDVMNRGGDADLNTSVVGALFGSIYSEKAIPERWKEPVMECRIAGRTLWHPSNLMTLMPKRAS
jgi:ADP-ribosyl-[dinitrogen reductase] hydrolase